MIRGGQAALSKCRVDWGGIPASAGVLGSDRLADCGLFIGCAEWWFRRRASDSRFDATVARIPFVDKVGKGYRQ